MVYTNLFQRCKGLRAQRHDSTLNYIYAMVYKTTTARLYYMLCIEIYDKSST